MRPSHDDLPSVSTPPAPRAKLDELRFSDNSRSLGTRGKLPCSDDASRRLANQGEDCSVLSESGGRSGLERLSTPVGEQDHEGPVPAGPTSSPHPRALPPNSQAPPQHPQTPPSIHRKAHRKTNRRKPSESSSSSSVPTGQVLKPHHERRPSTSRGPQASALTDPRPWSHTKPRSQTPKDLKPWQSWQRARREALKEEAFSDQSDLLDQTIEKVGCSYRLFWF